MRQYGRGALLAVILAGAGFGCPVRASDPGGASPIQVPSATVSAAPALPVADQVQAIRREADSLVRGRHFTRALAEYLKILALDPKNVRATQRVGWLYNEKQLYSDAEKYLSQAVTLEDGSAATWAELGFARYRLKKPEEALTAFQKAAQLNPELSSALFGEGDVYLEYKKDFPKAIEAYLAGLKGRPSDANANYHLGWCYNESKRFALAIPCLKKAVELNSEMSGAFTELGYAYFETGDLRQSKKACRRALHLSSKSGLAHYVLGMALLKDGDVSGAREQAASLKELDPRLEARLRAML
jgi:tetratricopeptide (TPR) repeat protein